MGDFLLDPRRLTVALSRAKQKMVLVASRSVVTVFPSDEEMFAHALGGVATTEAGWKSTGPGDGTIP